MAISGVGDKRERQVYICSLSNDYDCFSGEGEEKQL